MYRAPETLGDKAAEDRTAYLFMYPEICKPIFTHISVYLYLDLDLYLYLYL